MAQVTLDPLGSVDLLEFTTICEFLGDETFRYPFMQTRRSPASFREAVDSLAPSLRDRFEGGDLRAFRGWAEAYSRADIRVDCRVHYASPDTGHIRILAYRVGERGFFASQRPDEDVIDVWQLSPYELGSAIAHSAGLTRPGSHARIVAPGYVGYFTDSNEEAERNTDGGYRVTATLRHSAARPTTVTVPNAEVTALATVQSHWRPARSWGVDQGKKYAAWVQIRGDGEYLYTPAFGHAEPVTEDGLRKQINRLIADDVAVLRSQRGLD